MTTVFRGGFTKQELIPEPTIERAVAVTRSGRLHGCHTSSGETAGTALLQCDFRYDVRARYYLAVTSAGPVLATALRACGIGGGGLALTNCFTMAAAPATISAAYA